MNKSLLAGVLGGIGLASAGGVAGFVLLGEPSSLEETQVTVIPEPIAIVEEQPQLETVSAQPSNPPSPQPQVDVATVQSSTSPAPVQERCWDEEVTVQVEPRDDHAITGTAAGALLGGALAKKVGDDNDLLTAAGAIGGAFAGRRLQQRAQENNTETRIERRCEPVESQ